MLLDSMTRLQVVLFAEAEAAAAVVCFVATVLFAAAAPSAAHPPIWC
jgi:hypothetical protein